MPQPLPLDRPAVHVDVAPGGEIVLRGPLRSTFDGSVVDAATTTFPSRAPDGTVDTGGLVDFGAGGFRLTERNAVTHEVHALATGEGGEACGALGVQSPCLILRVVPQARSRLITAAEWSSSLKGSITLELVDAPAYAPVTTAASNHTPAFAAVTIACAAAALGFVLWRRRVRAARSPLGELRGLAKRVQGKLAGADAVLAATLRPALASVLAALGEKKVDASTAQGKRVAAVLHRIEARLDDAQVQAAAEAEQRAADELVRDVESALEAADEAKATL